MPGALFLWLHARGRRNNFARSSRSINRMFETVFGAEFTPPFAFFPSARFLFPSRFRRSTADLNQSCVWLPG